jgi:hypothetical protein
VISEDINEQCKKMKDRMKSKKVVAPLWCVDVHSSDYTRLALKDLQLKAYLNRVLLTARSSGGAASTGSFKVAANNTRSQGSRGVRKKVKANYVDGHASWVEVDRRSDGVEVKALATGAPARSMRTGLSKVAFQQGLAFCAFPKLPGVTCAKEGRVVSGNEKNGLGFHFRFCGRSLTYPLSSAGCLKDKVSGVSRLAFAERLPAKSNVGSVTAVTTQRGSVTAVTPLGGFATTQKNSKSSTKTPEGWMAKPSMASAAANFVLRDLSLLFHPHAPRQNPAAIFAKKLEELKSDSGVWGAKALVGTEEVRGMKGVGVLSRVPTFSRPLLGVRFSVSGRLNGKDMASTVWASGGKLPRSWVSPKVNEDLLCAAVSTHPGGGKEVIPQGVSEKAGMARLRSGGGLSYAAGTVPTRYGSLGLKVWLFF